MSEQTIKQNMQQTKNDQDCLDPDDFMINDVYWGDKPLTIERMREFGWPTTLEEAQALMEANARKEAESAT